MTTLSDRLMASVDLIVEHTSSFISFSGGINRDHRKLKLVKSDYDLSILRDKNQLTHYPLVVKTQV